MISIAINVAVYQHHYFCEKEISLRNQAKLSFDESRKTDPYQFHYAGKEKWSNVFSTYRLNTETGELIRYSYVVYEKTDDGYPRYDEVETLNMATGESKSITSSKDMENILLYIEEQRLDKINKNNKKRNSSTQSGK